MFYRSLIFVIFAGLGLSFASEAQACSISYIPHELVSEFVAKTDYVFEGTVEMIDGRHIDNPHVNHRARFNISDVLHSQTGSTPETLDVYYQFGGFLCGSLGPHFEIGKSYMIFAEDSEDGFLTLRLNSGDHTPSNMIFDSVQISSYFEEGQDSFLYGENCLQQIKQAYDFEVFAGDFKLDDERCLAAKPYFDRTFRTTAVVK